MGLWDCLSDSGSDGFERTLDPKVEHAVAQRRVAGESRACCRVGFTRAAGRPVNADPHTRAAGWRPGGRASGFAPTRTWKVVSTPARTYNPSGLAGKTVLPGRGVVGAMRQRATAMLPSGHCPYRSAANSSSELASAWRTATGVALALNSTTVTHAAGIGVLGCAFNLDTPRSWRLRTRASAADRQIQRHQHPCSE